MTQDWVYWPSDPIWLDSGFWDWRPPWVRPLRPGTMRWALQQVTPPSVEPVTLDEAKDHLNVTFTDHDALIQNLIAVARDYVERMTGVLCLSQTWKLYLDRFPRENAYEMWPWTAPPGTILIPLSPVQSVASLQWTDLNGNTSTVDPTTYVLDSVSRIARLGLAANKSWPATPSLQPQNAVVVTFTVGSASAGVMPPTLRQVILLMLGHWYANRESVVIDSRVAAIEVPQAAKALLGIHQPVLVG